jgi:hypothetical protein
MKALRIIAVFGLLVSWSSFTRAAPLGTAFTYQGNLADGGAPASGTYDLRFAVYADATGGTAVGGPITNSAVGVTNGLFTTLLEFGSDAFTGDELWLEIAVRSNGVAGDFTLLEPRQALTATPYAVRAIQFSGAVADGQLSGNIARLDSDQVFTGAVTATAFYGQGALLWQELSGPAQQAAPNTAYLATSEDEVAITLPTTLAVGDTIRVSGLGTGGWRIVQNAGQFIRTDAGGTYGGPWTACATNQSWSSVASSADGHKLVAVSGFDALDGHIYTSTDAGLTWVQCAESGERGQWVAVASSADGTKLLAADWAGPLYTSTNSGVTWTQQGVRGEWSSVASSADGSTLVAAGWGEPLYTSTNAGVSWTAGEYRDWTSVASSEDGTRLAAVVDGGQIYTSTNSGAAWTPQETNRAWRAVASSADGTCLIAAVYGGQIYTSTNSGLNWAPQETDRYWRAVASSANGTRLTAAVDGGQVYTSTDSGVTWEASETNRSWSAVALSAAGDRLVAVVYFGQIYTRELFQGTTPGPEGLFAGDQGSSVELIYAGAGQFRLVNASGTLHIEEDEVPTGLDTKVNRAGDTMSGALTNMAGFRGDGSMLTGIQGANIVDDSITSTKLAPNSVTTAALADGAATSPKILDGSVTAEDLADGVVTSEKIADSSITSSKLASNSVTAVTLAAGSVTSAKLGADVGLWSKSGADMYYTGGRVGIGGSYPQATLHVDGDTRIQSSASTVAQARQLTVSSGWGDTNTALTLGYFYNLGVQAAGVIQARDVDPATLLLNPSGGNVGIGTSTPTAKLEVNGGVNINGDLRATGTSYTRFPRPAYDSGWVSLAQGGSQVLNHGVGGDVANYVVDMQVRDVVGLINNAACGQDHGITVFVDWGAYWSMLNTATITVYRGVDNLTAASVRIRIWVY